MMARLMGGWISTFKHPPWRMNFRPASKYYDKTPQDIIFQHDGDPKHQSHQAKYWLKDMDSRSSHGLLNLQILALLSICGVISKGGLEGMKGHKEGYWSCGRG